MPSEHDTYLLAHPSQSAHTAMSLHLSYLQPIWKLGHTLKGVCINIKQRIYPQKNQTLFIHSELDVRWMRHA